MRGRRLRAAAAAAGAAVALAACGVPMDDNTRRIADRDVPFGLLDRPPSTTTSTTTAAGR
jgi:hypothetical protein